MARIKKTIKECTNSPLTLKLTYRGHNTCLVNTTSVVGMHSLCIICIPVTPAWYKRGQKVVIDSHSVKDCFQESPYGRTRAGWCLDGYSMKGVTYEELLWRGKADESKRAVIISVIQWRRTWCFDEQDLLDCRCWSKNLSTIASWLSVGYSVKAIH